MSKICCSCHAEKPLTDFYRSNVRYHQKECKACTKSRRSRWFRTDAGKASSRNTKLKARFGITAEEYDRLLEQQDGKCAICGSSTSYLGHRLAVDHDHQTQVVRGLLCKACNVGIGNLQDNPKLCRLAADYLEAISCRPCASSAQPFSGSYCCRTPSRLLVPA